MFVVSSYWLKDGRHLLLRPYYSNLLTTRFYKSCACRTTQLVKAEQSQPKYNGKTGRGFQAASFKGRKCESKDDRNLETLTGVSQYTSLPPIVSERMGKRMLYASSVPLTFFVALFIFLFVAKFQFDISFMPSLVAYSSLVLMLCTMAALSYGIFSASWDVEKEGSFWGWKEFRVNIGRTLEGFKSSAKK